eukprot:gb/GEZJ01005365.1/.p2 GENE.gb/GEZJ01005365.1/~~gb/GEZJ01005365.1/.p2  ORF type:complete len:164 (-),score=12.76 gb/GEZJ01005365.1/:587-1078(-)
MHPRADPSSFFPLFSTFEKIEQGIEHSKTLHCIQFQPNESNTTRMRVNTYHTQRQLSNAPFELNHSGSIGFLVSGGGFFGENPLLAVFVNESTQNKYISALKNFRHSSIANSLNTLTLDKRLLMYFQEHSLKDTGARQRQEMSNLICMLFIIYSRLRNELSMS